MIVTSVAAARAIWLLDVNDLNPRGRYIYDELFPWLVKRYRFTQAPSHSRDLVDNAWEFIDGVFVNSVNTPVSVTLRVYNDGFVCETRSSTDDSEAFLADALTAAVDELRLTFAGSMVHRKMYASELNLACEKPLDTINPRMREFLKILSEAVGTKCETTVLGFGGEPVGQPIFRFERKANVPVSQNRYWSVATLPTSVHLTLLEQLERLLSL